jgi:3-hydroxyethyl bacteriochlorophyllide a dehydrogenase
MTNHKTHAVVIEAPERLRLATLPLQAPHAGEVVVAVEWSGISTGTERLLWSGRMPVFPGLGYPLVPGYESVGRIVAVGGDVDPARLGERVFVPGANCFGEVRGLFGGAASHLRVSAHKVLRVEESLGEQAILLALAATAQHALDRAPARLPQLIVGHGVLGRLLARLTLAAGAEPPTVWEVDHRRHVGAEGYRVCHPEDDARRAYATVYDVSGDSQILAQLLDRLAPQGEIVLAGFYSEPLSLPFVPAFLREASIRVAAEWQPQDLLTVQQHIAAGRLSLDGLITHRQPATAAADAYRQAFADAECLKMVLDWRQAA